MKEALISRGPSVEIVDSDVPTPGPHQVLIKVFVSGSNPKDWKLAEYYGFDRANTGDDVAGEVWAVGSEVVQFQPGDRVAAMHQLGTPGGSYAEFALAPTNTTFKIPEGLSFEEAATVPLAALTASVLLFRALQLPNPRPGNGHGKSEAIPFLVYGAASAVGAFAIQLAKHKGIHPIIAVAGRGIPFVETILDKSQGDVVVDYRSGDEAVRADIRAALHGAQLKYALDAVRAGKSYINAGEVMKPVSDNGEDAKLALVLPLPGAEASVANAEANLVEPYTFHPSITPVCEGVNVVHNTESEDDREFGLAHSRLLAEGLRDGWLKPHPHEVQAGGLAGLEAALTKLKEGQASATKYVFRISDTPGISR